MKSLLCELQCVTFVVEWGNRSAKAVMPSKTNKFSEMKRPHRGRVSKRCCVFELLIIFNTTHQETIAAGRSMCFQQETDTMDVEQLKLLKGRFDSKTLVAGKRGRAVA
jgi:hypothetical protein